jgi:hypothetical protein
VACRAGWEPTWRAVRRFFFVTGFDLVGEVGLTDIPGFDRLAQHVVHGKKGIEPKGGAGIVAAE